MTLTRRAVCLCGLAALARPAAATQTAGRRPEGVLCALKSWPEFKWADQVTEAPRAAKLAVQLILDTVGLQPNFEVLQGKFNRKVGGFATIRDGRRYIVYDEDEFHFSAWETDWRGLGLMGHEIAHHLASHTAIYDDDGRSPHAAELEADFFAGTALARLGATLEQALIWTEDLNETHGKRHPKRSRRRVEVEAGWRHGRGMVAREGDACTPDWESPPVSIEGRSCRVARLCGAEGPSSRISCRDASGRWRWAGD
ncbi:MAG: hypothetical protein AAF192_03020 [Pseudomonadota bacterium]